MAPKNRKARDPRAREISELKEMFGALSSTVGTIAKEIGELRTLGHTVGTLGHTVGTIAKEMGTLGHTVGTIAKEIGELRIDAKLREYVGLYELITTSATVDRGRLQKDFFHAMLQTYGTSGSEGERCNMRCLFCGKENSPPNVTTAAHIIPKSAERTQYGQLWIAKYQERTNKPFDMWGVSNGIPLCGKATVENTCHNAFDSLRVTIYYKNQDYFLLVTENTPYTLTLQNHKKLELEHQLSLFAVSGHLRAAIYQFKHPERAEFNTLADLAETASVERGGGAGDSSGGGTSSVADPGVARAWCATMAATQVRPPLDLRGAHTGGRGGGKACYNCGEIGHLSRDCSTLKADYGGDRRGGGKACYNCGEIGHLSRDCPNSNNKRAKNP